MIKSLDEMLNDPELTPGNVKRSSKAAAGIIVWAQNIVDAKKTFDDFGEQPPSLANNNEKEPKNALTEENIKAAIIPQ